MSVRVVLVALALVVLSLLGANAQDNVCQEVASPTGNDDTIDQPIPREGYCTKFCRCTRDACILESCSWYHTWFNPVTHECEFNPFGSDCLWYEKPSTTQPPTSSPADPETTPQATTQPTPQPTPPPTPRPTPRPTPSAPATNPTPTDGSNQPSSPVPTSPPTNPCMTHPGIELGPMPQEKPKSCPPAYTDLLIPDPQNCHNFIVCNYGVSTIMHCPAPLKFRYDLQLCDYPHCADC